MCDDRWSGYFVEGTWAAMQARTPEKKMGMKKGRYAVGRSNRSNKHAANTCFVLVRCSLYRLYVRLQGWVGLGC